MVGHILGILGGCGIKEKKNPFLWEIGDKLSLFFMQNNEQKYKVDKFSYNLSEECKT